MGMVGNLKAATTLQLIQLKEDQHFADAFFDESEDKTQYLYLDKTWAVIHFILTGRELGFMDDLMVLNPFGQNALVPTYKESLIDFGYGLPLYLNPCEVDVVEAKLKSIDLKKFEFFIDIEAIHQKDIYPFSHNENTKEIMEYVGSYYQDMRELYSQAKKRGDCIIFWIN